MVIAPLSELYGRLVIYHACNVIYIGFIIGCALAQNTAMFLAFRFLAGCAASGPLTVGGGTVADVVPPAQRGKVMSLLFMGPLIGTVSGYKWLLFCKEVAVVTDSILPGTWANHWWLCL